MAKFKTGELISLYGGCYSDKWFDGPVRVIQDFDGATVAAEFVKAFHTIPIPPHPERDPFNRWESPDDDEMPRANDLMGFLIRGGYVEHAECRIIEAGDYEFEPEGLSASDKEPA